MIRGSFGTGSTNANPYDITMTLPEGTQAGDYALLVASINLGVTNVLSVANADFVHQSDSPQSNNNAHLFGVRIVEGQTSITVTSPASGRLTAAGLVLSDIDSVGQHEYTSGGVGTITSPTVTSTKDESNIFVATSTRITGPATSTAVYPSEWTKDVVSNNTGAGGASLTVAVGHITDPGGAGTYGGITVTTEPTASNMVVFMAVVNPITGPTITVWDGTQEVPATISIWNGTAEESASLELTI